MNLNTTIEPNDGNLTLIKKYLADWIDFDMLISLLKAIPFDVHLQNYLPVLQWS